MTECAIFVFFEVAFLISFQIVGCQGQFVIPVPAPPQPADGVGLELGWGGGGPVASLGGPSPAPGPGPASPTGTTESTITTTGNNAPVITIARLKDLYGALFTGYDTRIRPVKNQTTPIRVLSTFIPNTIIEFDTQAQEFKIMGYFIFQWADELLTWDPLLYSETGKIYIPTYYIWTPNLVIAKAFDGRNKIGDKNKIARVLSTGVVKWAPEGIYSVVCEVDIQFYPFDEQTCALTYFVAEETFTSVNMVYAGQANLEEYAANAEWDLLEHTNETRTQNNNYYIDLKFKLARRGSFIMFTVVGPLFMLSSLNGMVFLVPIDSGEKASFAITIFLSYGIFVTIVNDTLPHNSLNVSYLLLYIVSLLALSVVLVLYTVVQSKIFSQYGSKPCTLGNMLPKWIANVMQRKKMDGGDANDEIDDTTEETADTKKETNETKDETNETKDETEQVNVHTWAMFMTRLDTYLFYVFLLIIFAESTLFLTAIVNKIPLV